MSTDREWERFGSVEPYFGVATDARFRRERLNAESRAQFFEGGRAHARHVLAMLRSHVCAEFAPRRVLDFGCGVGRVLVAWADACEQVVGVDVSASMLEEAHRNCAAFGVTNAELVPSDDTLGSVSGKFDLVHSVIVFQHIPPARGLRILERLMERMAPGGCGALHFVHALPARRSRLWLWLRASMPGSRYWRNLLRGCPLTAPVMDMYPYDLANVLSVMTARGVQELHAELTDHGGARGTMIYFRAP